MIVNDCHFRRPLLGPTKDDTPLNIDPNGMEPDESAIQCLEPIPGRDGQIREPPGLVHLHKLAECHSRNRREAPVSLLEKELRGIAVSERLNHRVIELGLSGAPRGHGSHILTPMPAIPFGRQQLFTSSRRFRSGAGLQSLPAPSARHRCRNHANQTAQPRPGRHHRAKGNPDDAAPHGACCHRGRQLSAAGGQKWVLGQTKMAFTHGLFWIQT